MCLIIIVFVQPLHLKLSIACKMIKDHKTEAGQKDGVLGKTKAVQHALMQPIEFSQNN